MQRNYRLGETQSQNVVGEKEIILNLIALKVKWIKFTFKTTKKFRTPVRITRRNQIPVPDSRRLLFWAQPSGEAKVTGTFTTSRKDRTTRDKTRYWKGNNIN